MNHKQDGFTLIEVLIAATILFAVIGAVSQTYQGALIASTKATRSAELLGVTPLLLDTIRFRLKVENNTNPINDQGVIDGFEFYWTATIVQKGSPPSRFSPEDGEVINFNDKFYIWEVELTLKKQNFTKSFVFNELTWGAM